MKLYILRQVLCFTFLMYIVYLALFGDTGQYLQAMGFFIAVYGFDDICKETKKVLE